MNKEFDEIYKKFAGKIYWYIFRLCKNETEAEDILQKTFLRAIEKSDTFDGRCGVFTWLCRIAHNIWLDECKKAENKNVSWDRIRSFVENADSKRGKVRDVVSGSGRESADLVQGFADKEVAMQLHRCVHRLSEPYKEVFLLRTFGELSFREIGELFDRTENWARVTYYRGKERLKRMYQEIDKQK